MGQWCAHPVPLLVVRLRLHRPVCILLFAAGFSHGAATDTWDTDMENADYLFQGLPDRQILAWIFLDRGQCGIPPPSGADGLQLADAKPGPPP